MVKVVLDNDFEFNLETTDQDGSTDYITSCIKDFGNWEPNVTRKFVRILESAQKNHHPGLVLDIGSCFGYYSIISAKKGFDTIAFEPNPEVLPVLKGNINRLSLSNVVVNDFALGNDTVNVSIVIPDKNIGGAHLEMKGDNEISVPVKKLDSFELPSNITIIKIDAEGFEVEVIKGALNTIHQNHVEFIFLEVSPKFLSIVEIVNEAFKPLWKVGYLSYDIGLQDSGELSSAISTFQAFSDERLLTNHLQNIGQTNFLFIKKDEKNRGLITGSVWKDELLMEWSIEYIEECRQQISSTEKKHGELTKAIDELKNENRKLFDKLVKAGEFQEGLINAIKERDELLKNRQ